jgi:hypothetical protein
MTGYTNWRDVRSEFVARAGGEEAVAAGKEAMLAEVRGHRRTRHDAIRAQVADEENEAIEAEVAENATALRIPPTTGTSRPSPEIFPG